MIHTTPFYITSLNKLRAKHGSNPPRNLCRYVHLCAFLYPLSSIHRLTGTRLHFALCILNCLYFESTPILDHSHANIIQAGVALRIETNPTRFRVFPYENLSLVPFEAAIRGLNPLVAVKVRSASVHAALATVYVFFFLVPIPGANFLRLCLTPTDDLIRFMSSPCLGSSAQPFNLQPSTLFPTITTCYKLLE